jgi:hypothetical protein
MKSLSEDGCKRPSSESAQDGATVNEEYIITPSSNQLYGTKLMHLETSGERKPAASVQIQPSFSKEGKVEGVSRHSNRHAPRNTKERKMRSKIR